MTTTYRKNIPRGWQSVTVEDVCENLDNLRKPVTKSDRESGDVPYYGATGIVDYVKDYIFDEPLLLVGEDGADWSKFANTAYAVDGKSWVNNHAHVLRCTKADRIFLKEYLNHEDLNSFTTGGTRGKLTKGVLSKIPVLLPPLPEQQKIAEILGTVDDEIQKTEEIIAATDKLKKGLMRQLFTRGIGHTKFKNIKLGSVAKVQGGYAFKSKEFTDSGVPVLRISNISQGKIDLADCKFYQGEINERLRSFMLRHGDIVIAMSGATTGKIGRVDKEQEPILINQRVGKFVPSEKMNNEYLYQIVLSQEYQKRIWDFAIGGAQPNVSPSQLEGIEIPVPEIQEQKKIADILSSFDEKVAVNRKLKAKLILLKKGLMQDLLSGKVRVPTI